MFTRRKWKKAIAGGFILLLLGFASVGVLIKPQKAEAVGPVAVTFTVETVLNKIFDFFKNALVTALRRAGENALQLLLQRLAHDAAVWIASGGSGQGPLFQYKSPTEYIGDIGGQVVGEFVGDLNRDWSVGFDLCNPTDPQLKLQLKLGILQSIQPRKPKCDIFQTIKNWERLATNLKANFVKQFEPKELLSMFQQAFQPGNNDIGMMFTINDKMRISANARYETSMMNRGVKAGDFTDYTGTVSKRIQTPRNVVTEQFIQNSIKSPADQKTAGILATYISGAVRPETYPQALLATVTSTFINTLGSELQKRLMEGLFKALNPTDQGDGVYTGVAYSGRSAAEAQFAELKRPPIQIEANIDYLSEFASCPERYQRMNNCVVDGDFVTAVTHYNATREGMTVKEAMDEDLLHPNWLIYPIDHIKNSENGGRDCYRDGYCQRNLMRLRRARILPVGWEMVTELCNRDTNPPGVSCSRNDPPRLADVVRNYHNCDPKNPESIFCHLIDPNWVLKAPTTQCLAKVSGPQVEGQGVASRQDICVDDASCIVEDDNGSCKAYGYCTREKNIWRFGGDTCEARFEGCRTYDKEGSGAVSYIDSTIDSGICNASNAGCKWYSSVKDSIGAWSNFARDRIYFNGQLEDCDDSDAGCTRFIRTAGGLGTNMLANANFEKNEDGVTALPDSWYKAKSAGAPTIVAPGQPNPGGGINPAGPVLPGQQPGGLQPIPQGMEYVTDSTKSYENDAAIKPGIDGIYQDVRILSRHNYVLSAYVMNSSILKDNAVLEVELYKSGKKVKTINDKFELNNSTSHSRLSMEFGVTEIVDTARIILRQEQSNSALWFDAVMFEELSPEAFTSSAYADYGTRNIVRLKKAPANLGCYQEWDTFKTEIDCDNAGGTWSTVQRTCTAPTACNAYAGWCSEGEVGCNLYKQTRTDTPAIAATPYGDDYCPQGCSGYESFIQKGTKFEDGGNLDFFIPSTARQCNLESAGCDEFTNLEADNIESAEAKEYYSFLRACKKPDQSCKTFYTWEGSDTSGYQLRTFSLESNGTAPKVKGTDTCDEAKFKSNAYPDCRQFYHVDDKGVTHITYASLSLTTVCSNQCTTYRKTNSAGKVECEKYGGVWDTNQNGCIVKGLPSQSKACSADFSGCREYKGNTGNNVRTAFLDDFENGTNDDWQGGQNTNVAIKSFEHSVWNRYDATLTKDITPYVNKGSSYVISFYARSRSKAGATLSVQYSSTNFGQKVVDKKLVNQNGQVQLSDEWKQFTVGPVTLWEEDVDVTQVLLQMGGVALQELYIDKIQVQEITNRVFIVKDSWSTPLQCDNNNVTPFGRLGVDQPSRDNPQAQLNCKEYKDPKNKLYYLKSFSQLCRDSAVGCEALINTQNSESAMRTHYNVLCDEVTGTIDSVANTCKLDNGGDKEFKCILGPGKKNCYIDKAVNISTNKKCNASVGTIAGDVCTIRNNGGSCRLTGGRTECNVGSVRKYDPSEVIVLEDKVEFIVNNDKFECEKAAEGCQEIALPTLDAEGKLDSKVPAAKQWTSTFVLNQPDKYDKILCNNDELYCEEYTASDKSKRYFKDPGKRTCEFKSNVQIKKNGVLTLGSGWFKTNPSGDEPEPCYPSLTIDPKQPTNAHGSIVGSWDVLGKQQFHLAQKASPDYKNWVGLCPESQNMCTLFVDPLGTADPAEQNKVDISHYFYLKNEKVDTKSCNGQVSLTEGCILFDDTSFDKKNGYHAQATYDQSAKQNNKAIAPISCVGVDMTSPIAGKETCKDHPNFIGARIDPATGKPTGGVLNAPDNNTNTIIKVNRDRTCGEWLTCQSATKAKDNGKPITLCSKLVRCTSYNSSSGIGKCDDTEISNFDRLTVDYYQKRGGEKYQKKTDTIGWTDRDYSGYSIPNYFGLDTMVGLGFKQPGDQDPQYRLFHDTQNKDPQSEIRLGVCEEDKDCQEEVVDNTDPKNPKKYSPICVNNRCVLNIDGTKIGRTSNGGLNEDSLERYSPEPSCRAYPERESPFSPLVAVDPSIAGDYQNVNFCENCDSDETCSYSKVTYGNKSETRYFKPGTKAPEGICVGGSQDGKTCDPNNQNACKIKGDGSTYKDSGGRCEFKDKRIVKFNGWEGYCLERDFTAGTYRSANIADFLAPCVTWMPVKYMTGLKNLYENFASAGFNVEQEVRYCAETTLVRDVYTGQMKCAPSGYAKCDNNKGAADACREAMSCPKGHFIVYGACNSWDVSEKVDKDGGYCIDGWNYWLHANDECPYQCVPMGAVHAIGSPPGATLEIKKGDSCWDTASGIGETGIRKFKGGKYYYSVYTNEKKGYEAMARKDNKGHLVKLDKKKARNNNIGQTIFDDCVLPNVDMMDSNLGEVYSKPDVYGEYKLACKTLVQVNAEVKKGKNSEWANKAFTDRVAYDSSKFKTFDGTPILPYGFNYHGEQFNYNTAASPFSFASDKYVYQPKAKELNLTKDKANRLTGFVHPITGCRNDDKKPTYFGYGVRPINENSSVKIKCASDKFKLPILARESKDLRPNQKAIAALFEYRETTSFHKAEFTLQFSEFKPSNVRCTSTQADLRQGTENKDCEVCQNRNKVAVECSSGDDCKVKVDGQTMDLGTCSPAGKTKVCQRITTTTSQSKAKEFCGRDLTADEKKFGAGRKACYTFSCSSPQHCPSGTCNTSLGLCTGGKIMKVSEFEKKTSNRIRVGRCLGVNNLCTKNKDCFGECIVGTAAKGDQGSNIGSGWCNFSRVEKGDSKIQAQGESSQEAIKRLKQLFARVYEAWRLTSNATTDKLDYFDLTSEAEAKKARSNEPNLPKAFPQFSYDTQVLDWDLDARKNKKPTDTNYTWDVSDGSDPAIVPVPPRFAADTLSGHGEGAAGSVSVNGNVYDPLTSNAVELEEGTPVLLSFYAWASKNQMPLRKVVVSWGKTGQKYRLRDSGNQLVTCTPGQAGSTQCRSKFGQKSFCATYGSSSQGYCQLDSRILQSPDFVGRYKNRRAECHPTNPDKINGGIKGFGGAAQIEGGDGACDTDPFIFEHLYVLRKLVTQGTKRTTAFACEEHGGTVVDQVPRNEAYGTTSRRGCKFTIQVHLADNWGWCTGECDAADGGKFGGCYDQTNKLNSGVNISACDIKDDGSKAWKDAATVIVYERQK